jgi:hypothetical protein
MQPSSNKIVTLSNDDSGQEAWQLQWFGEFGTEKGIAAT